MASEAQLIEQLAAIIDPFAFGSTADLKRKSIQKRREQGRYLAERFVPLFADLTARNAALEIKLAEAGAALKPFAAAATWADRIDAPDNEAVHHYFEDMPKGMNASAVRRAGAVTSGHLRQARAVLHALSGALKEPGNG